MNSHCQIAFVHRKKTTRTTTTTKNSLTLRVNEKSREHCRQTRAKSILILVKKENIKNQHRNRCECNDWPCAYCMHACDRGTWNESKIESIFCYFQTTPFAGHNQSISIGRYDRGQDDTPVGNRTRWSMDFSRDHDLLCKINISFFFWFRIYVSARWRSIWRTANCVYPWQTADEYSIIHLPFGNQLCDGKLFNHRKWNWYNINPLRNPPQKQNSNKHTINKLPWPSSTF